MRALENYHILRFGGIDDYEFDGNRQRRIGEQSSSSTASLIRRKCQHIIHFSHAIDVTSVEGRDRFDESPKVDEIYRKVRVPYITDVTNYEKLAKIGQGTFGEVFKARCKRTGRIVALKKILMENEKEGFPITALREVKMLQKLKHKHITELIEICSSRASVHNRERSTFYLVFSFCEHDLAGLLSKYQCSVVFGRKRVNYKRRDIELADFGLARPLFSKLPGI
uniref:Protein kinase domain-containing protein n=1 Tax=Loa loa TaxID=7209 RepID=A0A1I7VTY2_LOALO